MFYAIPFPPLSPNVFAFSIGGFELALRWYALAYVGGIILAVLIMRLAMQRPALWPQNAGIINKDQLDNFITWAILGIILGGRLGYVLFYQPAYFMAYPQDIVKIWQGGMSFHGGFLGVCVAALLFARKNGLYLLSFADLLALSTPPALFLGRIANFINAELWGRETSLPWGVIFPGQQAQTCLNAAFGACARHPSQLYEALFEGLLLGAFMLVLAFKSNLLKKAGAATGLFFAGYGMCRFTIELVRQPDAYFQSASNPVGYAVQFGPHLGLSMGQLLSLPMIAVGIYLLAQVRRA